MFYRCCCVVPEQPKASLGFQIPLLVPGTDDDFLASLGADDSTTCHSFNEKNSLRKHTSEFTTSSSGMTKEPLPRSPFSSSSTAAKTDDDKDFTTQSNRPIPLEDSRPPRRRGEKRKLTFADEAETDGSHTPHHCRSMHSFGTQLSLGSLAAEVAARAQSAKFSSAYSTNDEDEEDEDDDEEEEEGVKYVNGKKVIKCTIHTYRSFNKSPIYCPPRKATSLKTIDSITEEEKRDFIKACDFVRWKVDANCQQDSEVQAREKAMLLFLLMKSVEFESQETENPCVVVASLVMTHAEGLSTFATAKVKEAAKKVIFIAKNYYQPILDYLQSVADEKACETPSDAALEMRKVASNSSGDKPPLHEERMEFIEEVMTTWRWAKCREMAKKHFRHFQRDIEKLVEAMDDCKKGGNSFIAVFERLLRNVTVVNTNEK